MVCTYCNGVLGQDESDAHARCSEEWSARRRAGKCAACGERECSYGTVCVVCYGEARALDEVQYRNYPGGA